MPPRYTRAVIMSNEAVASNERASQEQVASGALPAPPLLPPPSRARPARIYRGVLVNSKTIGAIDNEIPSPGHPPTPDAVKPRSMRKPVNFLCCKRAPCEGSHAGLINAMRNFIGRAREVGLPRRVRDLFFAFCCISLTSTARQPKLAGRRPRASSAVLGIFVAVNDQHGARGDTSARRWFTSDLCTRTLCTAHNRQLTTGEHP
jgi:hypothetical protein